ncbi:hypothetical protein CALCODRAFT_490336 [Calocera cornea HHB12733]|uniref:Uncharacterized protein n=1 Tax=Calocera cornea HHB12733 TaxID=1353952 RepID=A0A165JQR1_9BASI|nr:hypothetical protein CALCODRAFT_490336 [Calocera cornea HHB12733]
MLPTLILRAASTSAAKVVLPVQSIGHRVLPPRQSLYQVLARLPNDGIGFGLLQTRWRGKQILDSYWHISRVKLRADGTRGRAWGKLVCVGRVVSQEPEKISGGLKYFWTTISPNVIPLPKNPPGGDLSSAPKPPEAAPRRVPT